MAFHTACPYTCRKICHCTLGTPAPLRTQTGQNAFLQNALALQNLLLNPRLMHGGGAEYVEVLVPRLPNQPKKILEEQAGELAEDSEDDGVSRRVGSRRKATYSVIAAAEGATKSDHGKKLEAAKYASRQHASRDASANGWADRERAGMLVRSGLDDEFSGEALFQSLVPQVVCGLCSCGEAIGSEKAGRMLSCQACRKQYHRKCTKHWAEHRDLFNWASWVCGSCRSCEECKRTGDSNKLMFCKRCDQAYHAHCLQPALKHVPKGPFVCPKHVRCTSCSASIPGGGVSSKWFLSYSLCDACGRLFTRGKYCPICLKVYRDSEPAPMVCCDVCEHWVHCECDGISDEKYQDFQVNDDLRYKCASCRSECYKVTDLDEAAVEIWRRKDVTDMALIAEFRAAACLPSQEEMLKAYPSSDEDDREPAVEQVEETPKKPSKKKVKKVIAGTESSAKDNKASKKGTNKDSSNTKLTPSKHDGTVSKPKIILRHVNSEKTDVSSKKSKKGVTASGDGAERPAQGGDATDNSDAEYKEPEDRKRVDSPLGVEAAIEPPKKEKKRKSEGSKENGASTKKKRSSKAGELDGIEDNVPKEGKGKIKRLKFSNRQEIADRQDVSEAPSISVGRKVSQGSGAHLAAAGGSLKEGVATKVGKKERGLDPTSSARVQDARHEEEAARPASHSKAGAVEHSEGAQQRQAAGGTSPLHWVGHSDSIRRRRVPSSKYRDMDTSAWRQARTIRDFHLAPANPEPGPGAQTAGERIVLPAPEAATATKDRRTPYLPTATDARKERRKRPEDVEDNIDNDDSLDAPRKRLKVVDLGEKKSEGRSLRIAPASGSPSTRGPIRLKIRKQPSRDFDTPPPPASNQDMKKSGEEEEAALLKSHQQPQQHQLSKKKRSATVPKSGAADDPAAQMRPGVGDPEGDDSWILQRLGTDAIAKRVEIFWPMDNIWYKGTVVAVFPEKLQFVVHYDDGEEETLDFGKEKVRLRSSTTKKV